jgi:DNA repair exonuclease SbcCD nuclease subunit
MVTLLHTADQQLGVKFLGFGEKGTLLRQAVKDSLRKTVDLACAESVGLVLIAGDLFDSNTVSKNLVEDTLAQLKRLAPIPVCILPGTHDAYDASSVYRRSEFQGLPHLHIFTDEITAIPFPELDLTVYGKANLSPKGTESPLKGLGKTKGTTYHVAMAHGEIAIEGKSSGEYYPIRTQEIASSGMDYVALGHWHRYGDFSQGPVKALYPGAPETLSFEEGEDSGFVLLISLDDSGTRVERNRVGKYRWHTIEVVIENFRDEDELIQEIMKHADLDTLLQVRLSGFKPVTWDISEERLVEAAGDSFFHLRVITGDVIPTSEHIHPAEFPESTIMGQFLRLMHDRLEHADAAEKQVLQEALQRGFALLNGREA